MKKLILNIVFLVLSLEGFSQNLIWEDIYDYSPSDQDVINSVDETLDGKIVFCSSSYSRVYFVKCDLNGDTLWRKKRKSSPYYNTNFIRQLKNGQLMHYGNGPSSDYCTSMLSKIDMSGNILGYWNYGNVNKTNDFEALHQTVFISLQKT